ncbi:hypothetical protein GCK72_021359 [Caenorhabditis remanei]|uniref:F-box domain-containing protein n=1 Tax=Caenorhabditis remanei TaxID=31234 RepID=A0A6A5GJP9_CAERE|nr:hypothetical protein GCK72_021359 [Caenorhabditis remanei]KAF1754795.1 hypothetical protein GCK72_021359 [Caenorhabditis remanei]
MSFEPFLLQMPDVALNEIVKKCDYVSIQSLRKVCRDLRNFIEDNKPQYDFTNISIKLGAFHLYSYFNGPANVWELPPVKKVTIHYKTDRWNCTVSLKKPSRRRSKLLRDTNFVECFCRDFAIAIRSQKSIIQNFYMSLSDLNNRPRLAGPAEDLMRNLRNLKSGENFLLKVRNAELLTSEPSRIVDFLQLLDPNHLETIKISGDCFMNELTEITEICQLEQFKKAKELEISSYFITTPVECFSHFEKVAVWYRGVSVEMLRSLKQVCPDVRQIEKRVSDVHHIF